MKLSIVIPTYNVGSYIETTLISLVSQSKVDFEVVIVDDGSTDDTLNIVKEILGKSATFKYKIIEKENGGVSTARNIGLYQSMGKYVMFLDGDDYVSHKLVERIDKFLDDENDVVCWGFNKVDTHQMDITNYFDKYRSNLKTMSGIDTLKYIIKERAMFISVGSAAYRKSTLLKYNIKYTEGCSNGEDQEFTYKFLSKVNHVLFVNEVLSYYVQRIGSISNSYDIKRFDVINAMNRTIYYMEAKGNNKKLIDIANSIKNEFIIGSFLFNFNSCLNFIETGKSMKAKINIIYREIDKYYPKLSNEVLSIMKNYKGNNVKMKIKIRLFLFSPIVYNRLFSLKNFVDK
ncbi:glycosyltransferase family 2 protein [Peribacillus sp. YIM B13472]|uniref:glycosyltransferase family 2 protein n=1 Tax=Peribacillus sp. YIM B13472 TaxID=3366297 RepID=UPI0036716BDF